MPIKPASDDDPLPTTPTTASKTDDSAAEIAGPVPPDVARRILISLMFPGMLMPLISSMSRIALPIMRNDFQIQAETTAWIITAFSLPFMILMPVYGRLSDGLGKRRLLLVGVLIFTAGTVLIVFSPSLPWLMAGRVVQGIGTAGMAPLGLAFISTIFAPRERGKALGSWSSVGPTIAFIGPLLAGILVENWGWRSAFVPALLFSVVTYIIIKRGIPAGLSQIAPGFLRTFDWGGVLWLSLAATSLLFYLSSQPITGVDSLQDWRLLGTTLVLFTIFFWWEKQRTDPFVNFRIFKNRIFSLATLCAGLRMVTMGGISLLMPLYLTDVRHLSATYIGLMSMVTPGTMMLLVRFGGQISDRWGSRWPTVIGLALQGSTMVLFWVIPDTVPIWVIVANLVMYGLGAGLVLAALHRAAMGYVAESEMGAAAGLYSMLRFAGLVVGIAIGGVLLQNALAQAPSALVAYQQVYLFFGGPALIGSLAGLRFRESASQ